MRGSFASRAAFCKSRYMSCSAVHFQLYSYIRSLSQTPAVPAPHSLIRYSYAKSVRIRLRFPACCIPLRYSAVCSSLPAISVTASHIVLPPEILRLRCRSPSSPYNSFAIRLNHDIPSSFLLSPYNYCLIPNFPSFGMQFSPVKFSAQGHSTSELLRTLLMSSCF